MSKKNNRDLHPITRMAQALGQIDEITGAVTPSIELSTTYARDAEYAPRQDYIYARDGSSTLQNAEAILADFETAADTLLFSSGMSAFVSFIELFAPQDHILIPQIMYHGGINWLHRLARTRGQSFSQFDQQDPIGLEAALRPETKLVWIETPVNPNWDVIDIEKAAQAAHSVGAVLVVDCTSSPLSGGRAFELGADYVFHSGTKYFGGHSDILAGVMSCKTKTETWAELKSVRTLNGTVLNPFHAWLLIRSLRTLFLRFEKSCETALAIARYFEGHPKVHSVLYPGLKSHSGHLIAKNQMVGGFGGMLSLRVKGGYEAARKLVQNCTLFLPATSLGGVESLIEHRIVVEGPNSIVPDDLLRLSVGIEDADDLISDLSQALEAL